jgi:hypothetical protein
MTPIRSNVFTLVSACLVLIASPGAAQEAAQDPVAALKQNLQSSQAALKHYEWIEATTMVMKGEEKGTTQLRCYYDAEGKLTKVAAGGGEQDKGPGGLRGKAVAKKKEEISAAVKQSIALLESYFPLDPAQIQKAKDEGRFAVRPADANGRFGFDIKSYKKPGDLVSIDLDTKAKQLLKVAVSSYNTAMDKDAVNANVDFKTLPDGTTYQALKTLEVKSQSVVIKIANSGFKKT